jgi:hypothetical protein
MPPISAKPVQKIRQNEGEQPPDTPSPTFSTLAQVPPLLPSRPAPPHRRSHLARAPQADVVWVSDITDGVFSWLVEEELPDHGAARPRRLPPVRRSPSTPPLYMLCLYPNSHHSSQTHLLVPSCMSAPPLCRSPPGSVARAGPLSVQASLLGDSRLSLAYSSSTRRRSKLSAHNPPTSTCRRHPPKLPRQSTECLLLGASL